MTDANYIGRFAPSPTGHLHLGSLVGALGGFLRARQAGGQWLVRMEDLDPPREVPGAADNILATLEAHGLEWDGPVLYQSQRLEVYQQALQQLIEQGDAYPCRCSRKQVMAQGSPGVYGVIYAGTCRNQALVKDDSPAAWRIRTHNQPIQFFDLRCGPHQQRLLSEVGDFIIKRADGFFAYQLAVVVDDAFQGITEVVRGEDLLDNTPRQIFLQHRLGYDTPTYLHLPLVTNHEGQKLSKQTFAPPLDRKKSGKNLLAALGHLGFGTPPELEAAENRAILEWALENIGDTGSAFNASTALPTNG